MHFDSALVRFGTTGTLILAYGLVDWASRRAGVDRPRVPAPRWLSIVILASILGFYLTIRPLGFAVADGVGNAIGIALAVAAMLVRWRARREVARVRQPDVAARLLFYAALPAAAGSPWGWLALTLPALIASAVCAVREDRALLAQRGPEWRARLASSWRWMPNVW